MTQTEIERFCEDGELADQLAAAGRFEDAKLAYRRLLERLERGGAIDPYLAARVALGLICCLCASGEREAAFRAWNSAIEDSLIGVGVHALENAQARLNDMIRYDLACAYLHSISAASRERAAAAANQYLSRVAEHAIDGADRGLLRIAIGDWKTCLQHIFGGALPHDQARELIRFERELGEMVPATSPTFPAAGPWTPLEADAPASEPRRTAKRARQA